MTNDNNITDADRLENSRRIAGDNADMAVKALGELSVAQERVLALETALRAVEWGGSIRVGTKNWRCCLFCGMMVRTKHATDCALDAALNPEPAPLTPAPQRPNLNESNDCDGTHGWHYFETGLPACKCGVLGSVEPAPAGEVVRVIRNSMEKRS